MSNDKQHTADLKPPPPHPPSPHRSSPNRIIILLSITVLLILSAITILVLYLIYNPKKPNFTVLSATLYSLNLSTPPFLSAVLQFTLLSQNPNSRVSLSYDRLSATAYYMDEAITVPVQMPDLYQERKQTVAMEVVVGGGVVPVSEAVAEGLVEECEGFGSVRVRLVVMGRVRYRLRGLRVRVGWYGVYVGCDVLVGSRKGGFVGPEGEIGVGLKCKVDI